MPYKTNDGVKRSCYDFRPAEGNSHCCMFSSKCGDVGRMFHDSQYSNQLVNGCLGVEYDPGEQGRLVDICEGEPIRLQKKPMLSVQAEPK